MWILAFFALVALSTEPASSALIDPLLPMPPPLFPALAPLLGLMNEPLLPLLLLPQPATSAVTAPAIASPWTAFDVRMCSLQIASRSQQPNKSEQGRATSPALPNYGSSTAFGLFCRADDTNGATPKG